MPEFGAGSAAGESARGETPLFVYMAEAYRRAGELERAEVVLAQGLAHDDSHVPARILMAEVLREQGKEAEAAAQLRRVLDLQPGAVRAVRGLKELAPRVGVEPVAEPSSGRGAGGEEGASAAPPPRPDVRSEVPVAESALPASHVVVVALSERLVSVLERRGASFPAQASRRRHLALELGRELGVDAAALRSLELAALLCELGGLAGGATRGGRRARSVGARELKRVSSTLRLLEGVGLPVEARDALASQHEWWNGAGGPAGKSGEQIPLLARILAVARDVTEQSSWSEVLTEAGTRYDPDVVAALSRIRSAGGAAAGVVLAHPDSDWALELTARLNSTGRPTELVRAGDVRARVIGSGVGAVVLGADLPQADLAGLVRELRAHAPADEVVILVAGVDSPEADEELREAGADACVGSAASPREVLDVLVQLWRRAGLAPEAPPVALEPEPFRSTRPAS